MALSEASGLSVTSPNSSWTVKRAGNVTSASSPGLRHWRECLGGVGGAAGGCCPIRPLRGRCFFLPVGLAIKGSPACQQRKRSLAARGMPREVSLVSTMAEWSRSFRPLLTIEMAARRGGTGRPGRVPLWAAPLLCGVLSRAARQCLQGARAHWSSQRSAQSAWVEAETAADKPSRGSRGCALRRCVDTLCPPPPKKKIRYVSIIITI